MNAVFSSKCLGSKPGLVVALPAEGRALAGADWRIEDGRPVCRTAVEGGGEFLWVRSGVGPQRALAAARWLVGQNVTSLAVFGVSGGLAPGLAPGQLIVADAVIDGTDSRGKRWSCPEAAGLRKALQETGLAAELGPIVTTADPVLEPEQKMWLRLQTGALAVDMESAAVAQSAAEAGLNCLVVRAVCDPAERRIPAALFRMVDGEGRPRIPVLLRELLRRPKLILDLLTLQRDFSRALQGLKKGVAVLLGE